MKVCSFKKKKGENILNIRKINCPKNLISVKCPYKMEPRFIVVHNTANDASAYNEVKYMLSNNKQVSFHYAVDDQEIVQGIDTNRNAWHAGDGVTGRGNRYGIAIEICYSKSGGEKFDKAENNAAKFIAQLLKQYNFDISKVTKHRDYSGKNCPHRTLLLGWNRFINKINFYLKKKENNTNTVKIGSKVIIKTMDRYKYWISDDVKKIYGIYQVRENVNAGGKKMFNWSDNGIPEGCIDIVDGNGKKIADSDKRHIKKGEKFVFVKVFTITKITNDNKYYQLDYDNNKKHRFWVIKDYLHLI